jgi:pimeloyl-ACP methyl ester carboxylesterase
VHRVINALRGGEVAGRAFGKVLTVGHSFGSIVGWAEAAKYHDVNGLISSGWTHIFDPVNTARLFSTLYPAVLDPNVGLAGGPDPGYLTTRPGTRSIFYYPPSTDPAVLALDEKTKQTVTAAELSTFPPSEALPETRNINVPVLLVVGKNDMFFCGGTQQFRCRNDQTLTAAERPYFAHAPQLSAVVLPDTGHDMNLQTTAPRWYDIATRFSDSIV